MIHTSSKSVLVAGAVKPWHVVFVLLVAYAVSIVAGDKLTHGIDEEARPFIRLAVVSAIAAAIYIAYSLAVPEFRRELPMLFARPAQRVKVEDISWTVIAMAAWGYGFYRVAVLLPVLAMRPDLYDAMHFVEAIPPFEPRYLLVIACSIVIAPLGEELMFRGFLMNLWIARKGKWFGVIVSSVVFGLFHWDGALFAAALGVLFALVYLRYDSLWPGIGLHALYNATTPFWLVGGLVATKPRADAANPAHWILELLLAFLFFPAAWQFWRRFRPRGI
jgi:membrane protease YdiL (CAAX protease family)